MARGDQLGRQWRIIQTLLSSKLGKSAAELADGLDCNPRTVYRDLEALQVAGFPIYTERIDGKNLWSLLDTMKHQLPIPFNLMELMALYFSRDMMKVFKDTVFYDSLESLFHKIKTTLPKESLGDVAVYVDHLEGYIWAENFGWIRVGTHTGGSPHEYKNTDANNYGVNHRPADRGLCRLRLGGERGLDQPQGGQRGHGLRGDHRFSPFRNLFAFGTEAIVNIFS
jgi:biotin operon repressor